MNKYVKNPIEITAIQYQWDDVNISMDEAQDKIADFVGGNLEVGLGEEIIYLNGVHGTVEANRSDWIIKQNDTDFYPCSDEVFQQNYKAAPSTFLDRLKVEQVEVQTRLDGLTKTLDVESKPDFISEDQWILMSRQQFHMRMYAQIIGQRIDEAEGKPVFINKRLVQLEGSETASRSRSDYSYKAE